MKVRNLSDVTEVSISDIVTSIKTTERSILADRAFLWGVTIFFLAVIIEQSTFGFTPLQTLFAELLTFMALVFFFSYRIHKKRSISGSLLAVAKEVVK